MAIHEAVVLLMAARPDTVKAVEASLEVSRAVAAGKVTAVAVVEEAVVIPVVGVAVATQAAEEVVAVVAGTANVENQSVFGFQVARH